MQTRLGRYLALGALFFAGLSACAARLRLSVPGRPGGSGGAQTRELRPLLH